MTRCSTTNAAEAGHTVTVIVTDPGAPLEVMFRRILNTSMRDLPFLNPALSVEAVGFHRWPPARTSQGATGETTGTDDPLRRTACGMEHGDWIGVLITPWFISLFLLPGGGDLWCDRPAGSRSQIEFPIGPIEFISSRDESCEVPCYQYCPLFAPPGDFASQPAARAAAMAVLASLRRSGPDRTSVEKATTEAKAASSGRRAFLRRIMSR